MTSSFKNRGFSLLEILLSLVIVTLLSTLAHYSLSGFKNRELLETNTRQITALLEEARSLTLSGQGGLSYGVYFQADRAVRFSGTTYATATVSNVVYLLDSALNLSKISLAGGGPSVLFNKLTGKTDTYGSVELNSTIATTTKKIIYINATGIIDVQ
jgi:prepilin-type N-terminal cleavage/methylation domain-containing protein